MWEKYSSGDEIKNITPDMQLLLRSFFNSILAVKKEYLYWSIKDDKIKSENMAYVERAFAYELYFQWKMNDTFCGIPMYKIENKLRINAEIKKHFVETVCKDSNFCYPDMVLHGGNETDNNFIVCEIKRKETVKDNRDSLTDDINKLGFFLRDDLHTIYKGVKWSGYKYAVFLLTGQYWGGSEYELKPSDLTTYLNVKKINVNKDCYSRIICILYNGVTLYYDNLHNIIIKQ